MVKGNVEKDYANVDSFVIYLFLCGKAEVETNGKKETIVQGKTILIPAKNKTVTISSEEVELLEVYIQ